MQVPPEEEGALWGADAGELLSVSGLNTLALLLLILEHSADSRFNLS